MPKTTKGVLPIGVEHCGVMHRAFELRAATVADNIAATDDLIERGEGPEALRLSTALMAQQIVSIGSIPRELITTDTMRGMHIADWNVLDNACTELQKKLSAGSQTPTPDGGSTSAPGSHEPASTQLT